MPHGRYVAIADPWLQVEGHYVHGQREGRWVWMHLGDRCDPAANGGRQNDCGKPVAKAEEGTYHAGLREGLWRSFWQTGEPMTEGHYRSGKKDGTWRRMFMDPTLLIQITCRAGVADGPYLERIEHDRIQLQGTFRDDEPVGTWSVRYPGLPPRTISCEPHHWCEPVRKAQPWSDMAAFCESFERDD
jgi:antitoxin component YwqK of YwqJK toxin-antitoxin module